MRFAPHKSYARQQGLSLIEVMIALLIGIILMSGAVSIFISNNAAANLGAQLSRMQDNGRLLIDVLSRNIRMAGYSGCTSRGNVTPNVVANSSPLLLPFSDNSPVQGYDAVGGGSDSWVPSLPTSSITPTPLLKSVSNPVHDGTDILVVRHVDECVTHVAQLTSTTSTIIVHPFPSSCNISPITTPLPLIISNCNTADVFQISDDIALIPGNRQQIAYDSGQNSNATLSASYDTDATVSVPFFSIFYIGENSDPNVREPLSLYMLRWEPGGNDIYKLADGVEDMQILYGEDTVGDGYADTYKDANSMPMPDWSEIRSVRIELLLRSTNNTTSEPQPYTFPSTTTTSTTPGDRRLRFAFSTTISLRNRLP